MTNDETVRDLLEKHFADECEVAGPGNVADVAAGRDRAIESANTGKQFDLIHLLQVLYDAAHFIKEMIAIYLLLRGQNNGKNKPTPDEVIEEANKKGVKRPESIDAKKEREIVNDIVNKDPQSAK
jgi:hypothetical protein